MFSNLGKHGAQAVALEVEQRAPDRSLLERRLLDQRLFRRLVGQKVAEQVEQSLEIDELGSGVSVAGLERTQNFLSHVLGQAGIVPQLVEPGQQVLAIAIAIDDQIEFDVWRVTQSKSVDREI